MRDGQGRAEEIGGEEMRVREIGAGIAMNLRFLRGRVGRIKDRR